MKGARDDHGVIEGEAVVACEPQGRVVRFHGKWLDPAERPHGGEHLFYLRPRHTLLAGRHARELVQDLNADRPALGGQSLGSIGFRRVRNDEGEPYMGVEERPALSHAHWPPPRRT